MENKNKNQKKKTYTQQSITKIEYDKLKKQGLRKKLIALACTFLLGVGAGCGAYYGVESALQSTGDLTIIAPADVWEPVSFEADREMIGLKFNKELFLTDWKPNVEGLDIIFDENYNFGTKGFILLGDESYNPRTNYGFYFDIEHQVLIFGHSVLTLTDSFINSDFMKTSEGSYIYDFIGMVVYSNYYLLVGDGSTFVFSASVINALNRLTDLIAPIYADTITNSAAETLPQTEKITLPIIENQTANIFEK